MSKKSLIHEDESEELGSFQSEVNNPPHKSRKQKNGDESSEMSSDSSATASYKQSKSPHTLLKSDPSVNNKVSPPTSPTVAENDLAEHLQRRLQELEQSLSNRDVLISMLREQLSKTENLYKQTVDDGEDLRHKHCLMTQDLSNLTIICNKYKEDASVTESQGNKSDQEILALQNDVENWKTQYNNLLSKTQVVNKEVNGTKPEKKISAEIQVDLNEHAALKNELDILKNQYIGVKNCLEEQNKKMDFVVEQLQQHTNTNNNLDLIKEKIDTPREVIGIPIEQNIKCDEDKHKRSILKKEVEHLKLQIEHLNNINTQLQSEFREIDKFKEEVKKLSLLASDSQQFVDPLLFPGLPLDARDSLVGGLTKENHHLKDELQVVKHSIDFTFFDSTDDTASINDSIDGRITAYDQDRNRRVSKVSFAGTNRSHPDSPLHSKEKIKEFSEYNTKEYDTEMLHAEIVRLRNQLEKQEETLDELKHEAETIASTKNRAIKDFENANQLLKKDYQELLKINTKLSENLKKVGMYEKMLSNQVFLDTTSTSTNTEKTELNNTVSKLKNDLEGKSKQLEVMSKEGMEKDKIIKEKTTEIEDLKKIINDTKNKFESKLEELTELKGKTEDLQTTINMLRGKVAKGSEEHEKHSKVCEEHEGCKCIIKKLEATILERENTIETYRKENQSLKLQITGMKNNSKQFRKEADLKKIENEKLREKEEQLEKSVTSVRRNCNNVTKEFEKEVEKNKELLKKYNEIERDLQTQKEETAKLKKSLEQKDEDAKTLRDKINEISQKTEEAKSCNERTFCQMNYDFKNREAELLAKITELEKHQINPLKEEENIRLKERLQAYIEAQENLEYGIKLKHGMDLKTIQDDYNNEKAKNAELNGFLHNMRNDVDYLRVHIEEILKNFELKLTSLKNDLLENKCQPACQKSIDEMLTSIQEFKDIPLQQESSCKSCSGEIENYNYCYYDDENVTKSTHSQSANTNICNGNSSPCSPIPSTSVKELELKRDNLLTQLGSTDRNLNDPLKHTTSVCVVTCGGTSENNLCKHPLCRSTSTLRLQCLKEPGEIRTTADDYEDLEIEEQEELQESRLENIDEMPELKIESQKSSDKTVSSFSSEEKSNELAVVDKIGHRPSCCSRNSAECKLVLNPKIKSISPWISHDVSLKNSNVSLLNVIYQSPHEESSMLSSNISEHSNKKHAPTAIPVPIHNSHQRKSKEDCCSNTGSKVNNKDSSRTSPSSSIEQNASSGSKEIPQSSCGCLKKVSRTTSSQSKSSNNSNNLKKSCVCLRDDSPAPGTSKDNKQCKCKDNGENNNPT